ncbi:hypothetical protein [Haloglycomyces albus]|uniref:hypothetical protein n=1 Tax=Haloglycomyces albus TaxID=526067 RepID=UPI00046D2B6A|nr:hypothetical protein [Haloglycomyces albus]
MSDFTNVTIPEYNLLIGVAALDGNEVPNKELVERFGLKTRPQERQRIKDAKKLLIDGGQGHPLYYTLTDPGWDLVDDLLNGDVVPKGSLTGRSARVLHAITQTLAAANRANGSSIAGVVLTRIKDDTTPDAADEVVNILDAADGDWVPLQELRSELAPIDKDEIDAVLTELFEAGIVQVAPEENRASVTPEQHDAGWFLGGTKVHYVMKGRNV